MCISIFEKYITSISHQPTGKLHVRLAKLMKQSMPSSAVKSWGKTTLLKLSHPLLESEVQDEPY